jgi:hypothetical protein
LCESSHAFTAQCLSNFYEVQKWRHEMFLTLR